MAFEIALTVDGDSKKDLAAAAGRIEVYESMGETTAYRLVFGAEPAKQDIPMLTNELLDPDRELGIFAKVGDQVHCLVNGPIYGQEIKLKQVRSGSFLVVLGGDRGVLMDRETKIVQHADGKDSDAIQTVLGAYSKLTADVEATPASHTEAKHTTIQCETDLQFVRRLARRNGADFWIAFGEDGAETAHVRRPKLDDDPAGTIDLANPNVEEIDICWDVQRPATVSAAGIDANSKDDISGDVSASPLPALGEKAFGEIATHSGAAVLTAPVDEAGDLRARAEGLLIRSAFFLRARCALTTTAAGRLFRSHTIVNLKGAGSRHSGKYYCAAVRHIITDGNHTMQVELVRNGWGFKP
jgi:hypothetical protein